VQVEATGSELAAIPADLRVVVLADGEGAPDWLAADPGAGDIATGYRKQVLLHPPGVGRTLVLGAGDAAGLDTERLRVLGALATGEARRREARSLAVALPPSVGVDLAPAIVEGTILASFRFERFRSHREPDEGEPAPGYAIDRLTIASVEDPEELATPMRVARAAAEAANRARELQSLPANVLTPSALADRARALAVEFEPITVEVLGRAEIAERGMGGLAAVASGSEQEPRLICLRYSGRGSGEVLGLVGKAVTFDSGGISIKPAASMHEMKMDMSGGAAVLEAVAAIAELGLQLDIAAVVPATENMPSGSAMRPGDVITQLNGKTVEVNNTDAEGRLILADALTWCVREMGAARVVDLATLTGAVIVALGSTYSALIANDEELAGLVAAAAERTGELAWRLPLHDEYKDLTRGTVADLTNSAAKRKAGTIYAGSFLEEFVDGVPWAHLDIAGTAWDVGREYVGKGPTGVGVRLLVSLAETLAGR
jgi:leucyl aminopeptidase